MNSQDFYSGYLYTALAHTAQMSPEAVDTCMAKFDKLVKAGGPNATGELAFTSILSAFGSEDEARAVKTVKATIQKALEAENARHPGIDTNLISRIRRAAENLNRALDKCASIEVNGKPLTKEEIDTIRPFGGKMPDCFKSESFTALAKVNGKPAKFGLDVKFSR